ncbi:NUDIX hydrolase [Paracoccus sp. S3-43]|uniref:NUDIX hydrolase n=1 Tax=Paracoccus sp. S3-43 TaxID=3030011 RepID=UPI0023B19F0B|nr:NUDIX hydrolase [Paracoccus sp. S3-43]WEF24606.1 NUDIX hydrolase [Paracoccus sp. S3-43]
MNAIGQLLGLLIGRRPPALQVGAVCRCIRTGDVVLITSRGTGRWVIPKGWPMEGKSLPAAAATEAWEEAGIEGRVQDAELGRYRYDKEQDRGFSVPIEVRVFLLEADRQRADFPEAKQRKRRWFAPADAARLVAERGLREILLALPPIPG